MKVQTFCIIGLDVSRLIPGIELGFEQLSLALGYSALVESSRGLTYFITLFPNLPNIHIDDFSPNNAPIPRCLFVFSKISRAAEAQSLPLDRRFEEADFGM